MVVADVWKNALKIIEQQVTHVAFVTWFKDAKFQEQNGEVKILTSNVFMVKQLETRYDQIIRSALQATGLEVKNVEYLIDKTSRKRPTAKTPTKATEAATSPATTPAESTSAKQNTQTNLNSRYTLANFVIGSNNDLAVSVAKAVIDHFGKHIVFINVMRRMSVDCDCAGTSAAEPTIPDIGIVASTDILAVDQASVDLVYGLPSSQNHDLVERIESRRGLHQLQAMRDLKMGNDQYELISID